MANFKDRRTSEYVESLRRPLTNAYEQRQVPYWEEDFDDGPREAYGGAAEAREEQEYWERRRQQELLDYLMTLARDQYDAGMRRINR